ncbi:hypothetical protein P0D75_12665 [Paraburkholderia sediminicola]
MFKEDLQFEAERVGRQFRQIQTAQINEQEFLAEREIFEQQLIPLQGGHERPDTEVNRDQVVQDR